MRVLRQLVMLCALLFGILGLLALLSLRSVPVYSGPGRVATTNGDANCDGRLTIADPIQVLNFLFLGGSPPCAIAQGNESCCAELTAMIQKLTTPGGTSLRALTTPCGEVGRYVNNGDGTVTDTCTELMWQESTVSADLDLDGSPEGTFNFNQAFLVAGDSEVAGYTDWRLPTAGEAETLLRYVAEKPYYLEYLPGFAIPFGGDFRWWTSTEKLPLEQQNVFCVTFGFGPERMQLNPLGKHERLAVLLVRGGGDAQPAG